MKTCTVKGCDRPQTTRMLCKTHYGRLRAGIALATPIRPYTHFRQAFCSVDGCGREHSAMGYCRVHYYRWKRHSDPLKVDLRYAADEDAPPTPPEQMTAADADRIHRAGAWNVPLPGVTKQARTIPHIDQPRYAAQNERDGYLTDPEYIAAVAAWRAEPLAVAAD